MILPSILRAVTRDKDGPDGQGTNMETGRYVRVVFELTIEVVVDRARYGREE